jgi:hypothetical protein
MKELFLQLIIFPLEHYYGSLSNPADFKNQSAALILREFYWNDHLVTVV